MINTLIGRKIDQKQKFLENGKRLPVTLIAVGDNAVLQVKTQDKDAYSAVQLGFGDKKKANKASVGHAKKAGFDKVSQFVKEVRLAHSAGSGQAGQADAPAVGEYIAVDSVFKPGDIITISGTSKGKGFAGVVKRHGFRGGPKTHGQSDRERAPGSIGQTTTPGRVYRGKKMAGRMGSDVVTVENLTVLSVDAVNKMLLVSGLVPGHKDTILLITKTGTKKKFVPLLEDVEKAKAASDAAKAEEKSKEAEVGAEEIKEPEEAKVEVETASTEEPVEVVAETKTEDEKDTPEESSVVEALDDKVEEKK